MNLRGGRHQRFARMLLWGPHPSAALPADLPKRAHTLRELDKHGNYYLVNSQFS